jgi:ATP-dependent Clp protease ATP-binding subunit ClpA
MATHLNSWFTKELRAIDARARRIAFRYHHEQIDLAHFLLAFITDPSESYRNLSIEKDPGLRVTQNRVQAFLESLPRCQSRNISRLDIRFTRRLESIVHLARRDASRISPARLFLALASEDFYAEAERGAIGERLLSPAGMTPGEIERRLQTLIRGGEIGNERRPIS